MNYQCPNCDSTNFRWFIEGFLDMNTSEECGSAYSAKLSCKITNIEYDGFFRKNANGTATSFVPK